MPNKELLKKVMDKINSIPSLHDLYDRFDPSGNSWTQQILDLAAAVGIHEVWHQGEWFRITDRSDACGTAGCFAGWAAILSGAKPFRHQFVLPPDISNEPSQDIQEEVLNERADLRVDLYARQILGLTLHQAEILFAAYNTRADLNRYVNNLLNDRPIKEGASE